MTARFLLLPGTGRWQPEGLTEGARRPRGAAEGPLHHPHRAGEDFK
jgi:hypothetical protein